MKRRIALLLALIAMLPALAPPARASVIPSEWVPESKAPAGAEIVDEKWVVTEVIYKANAEDPEMAGFEIYKTDWLLTGSTDTYYATVPQGFDTNHYLYRDKYRLNQGGMQTGYTSESEKVEVTNSWETYIYWHWMYDCGGANGHSKRAILDYYGRGRDNNFVYKYFGAFDSKNGNYSHDRYYCNSRNITNYIVPEQWRHGECQGATRWFRFDVYKSTARRYVKKYFGISHPAPQEYFDPARVPPAGTSYTFSDGDPANRTDTTVERYVRYEVEVEDVASPYANFPDGARLAPGDTITLSCANPEATILYAVGENVATAPTEVYTGPFQVLDKENFVVSARAVLEGMGDSPLAAYTYHVGNLQGFPSVTTLEAEQVTETSAVLPCRVESGSRVLQTQFVYYEKGENMKQYAAKADSGGRYLLSDLTPGTEYWFQARATNLYGSSSGNVCSFRTKGKAGIAPSSVSLSPSYAVITPGGTRTLLATVLPAMSKRDVYWSSEDETIATVDENGRVTGRSPGMTRILATTVLGRKQAACTVEVYPQAEVTGKHDFSEYNMLMSCSSSNTESGFDFSAFRGGNSQMATAYLARWGGAVAEENDPYPSEMIDHYVWKEADFHVQEILYLPWRRDALDNGEIKKAVMKYGAVYAALRTGLEFRSNNDRDFYLPADRKGSKGHTVAVVGWDDDYPASNFAFDPPGDGAFICKNSWGPQSGQDGYCYISYYDSKFAMEGSDDIPAVFYFVQTSDNYNRIYQYDELGAVDVYQDFGGSSGWYANVFPREGEKLSSEESLKAVSFYTVSPGTSYELYAVPDYRGPNSLCQLGEPLKSGSIDYAGYHTISLSEPVRLAAGTRFAVVVRITDCTGDASVFIEAPRAGISSRARAGAGESFVRGVGGVWTDLRTVAADANVCLKAFTLTDAEEAALQGVQPVVDDGTRYTEEELAGMSAGLNPAFLAALNGSTETAEGGEAEHGLLPPSILPNLNSSFQYAEGARFPARYDLREEGFVTPVRSQQGLPACWTFAAYASLESCVLRAGNSGYSLAGGLNQAGDDEICILLNVGESSLNLSPGGSEQLATTIYPFDSDAVLFWESSDDSVVTVSPHGTVTAKAPGSATVTVSTEDKSASTSCDIHVLEARTPRQLSVSSPEAILQPGKSVLLSSYADPTPVDPSELIWESEDPSVAAVDEYGMLTAVGRGITRVHASTADRAVSADCEVCVDDGGDLFSAVSLNELAQANGEVGGNLSVLVRSRGGTRRMTLVLAFYGPDDRCLHTVLQNCSIEPGDNRIIFDDVGFSSTDSVRFKVYVLSGDGSLAPLDGVLSGSVFSVD